MEKDKRKKESRKQTAYGIKGKNKPFLSAGKGFSLVELLVVLAIFSVIIAVVVQSYISQLQQTTKEYRKAEAQIEVSIAKNIIGRDLSMAGYGLADDYSAVSGFTLPVSARATDGAGAPDTLTLMGTALGFNSRAAQGWTYIATENVAIPVTPASFQQWLSSPWNDAREDVKTGDRVIIMEPASRKLLAEGAAWLFNYDPANLTPANRIMTTGGVSFNSTSTYQHIVSYLLYGLYTPGAGIADATQPYYAVWYGLGGTPPSTCASGTQSLIRNESRAGIPTSGAGGGEPILDCVFDFEVAFGLDTSTIDGSGPINAWDNGGQTWAAGYDAATLRKRLKQIRAYILVQSGNYDPSYTYPATSVWVGDTVLGVGRNVAFTPAQLNYRWKVISIAVTPRNII